MASASFSLQARYVFPVVGPPIEHGVVTICDGRIASVGTRRAKPSDGTCYDLGQVAVVPGLINAIRTWNSAIWPHRWGTRMTVSQLDSQGGAER